MCTVAYNFATPETVMEAWMRSPSFKRIGVGCVIDGRGHRWSTQDFSG